MKNCKDFRRRKKLHQTKYFNYVRSIFSLFELQYAIVLCFLILFPSIYINSLIVFISCLYFIFIVKIRRLMLLCCRYHLAAFIALKLLSQPTSPQKRYSHLQNELDSPINIKTPINEFYDFARYLKELIV